jgi:aspartyl protease family protein
MKLGQLLPLFAFLAFIGWAMRAPEEAELKTSTPALTSENTATVPALNVKFDNDQEETGQVILARQADGHFYANADVDGNDVRFLIDTGASGIALTGADADALAIPWDETDLVLVGRGVSGDVYGKHIILKSVRVGDFEVRDVPAAIIPNGLDVSLLGQSFLGKIGTVNIAGDRMTLQ